MESKGRENGSDSEGILTTGLLPMGKIVTSSVDV